MILSYIYYESFLRKTFIKRGRKAKQIDKNRKGKDN